MRLNFTLSRRCLSPLRCQESRLTLISAVNLMSGERFFFSLGYWIGAILVVKVYGHTFLQGGEPIHCGLWGGEVVVLALADGTSPEGVIWVLWSKRGKFHSFIWIIMTYSPKISWKSILWLFHIVKILPSNSQSSIHLYPRNVIWNWLHFQAQFCSTGISEMSATSNGPHWLYGARRAFQKFIPCRDCG